MAMPDALRDLAAAAARGGMPADELERVVRALLEQQLELAELRRCADSRKRQTLRLAARISKANRTLLAAKAPNRVARLCGDFGLHRSRLYELLKLSVSGEISDTSGTALGSARRSAPRTTHRRRRNVEVT